MKKILSCIILVCLFILPVSASGSNEKKNAENTQSLRIISLGPNITETIFALGKEDILVGRTDYCDYPSTTGMIESVGDLYNPSIEKIASLTPDIVICSSLISPETINSINAAGIQTIIINPQDSLEGTFELIKEVGSLTGAKEEAELLCSEIESRIEKINKTVLTNETERKNVYYCIGYGELGDYTATGDTFISGIIEAAGGINIAKEGRNWLFNKESLLVANPEVILIPVYSYSNPSKDIQYLTTIEPYSKLSASQNDNFILVDGNLMDRQGPRIADAVEALAYALYPELF